MSFDFLEMFSNKIKKVNPLQSIKKVNGNLLFRKRASNLPFIEDRKQHTEIGKFADFSDTQSLNMQKLTN